jgi:hypothetical protein
MKIGYKSAYHSQTGWEKSHFGGHERLIWDFPTVSIPDSIKVTPQPGFSDLGFYASGKLLKMFLVLAEEGGLMKYLFDPKNAKEIEVSDWRGVQKKIQVKATTEQLKTVLLEVLHVETELAPLFDSFKDFIVGSSFEVLLDPPENGEGKSGSGKGQGAMQQGNSGQGQGQGEGQGEGEGQGQGDSDGEGEGQGQGEGQGEGESKDQELTGEQIIEHITAGLASETKKAKRGYQNWGAKNGYTMSSFSTGCTAEPKFKRITPATKPTKFTQCEKQNAEMLLKMLDITWDSDKDIVKSLRLGKIDISKIAEVPAGNVAVYQREMEEQSTKPFSICILVDESGSMGDVYSSSTYRENKGTSAYRLTKSLYAAFRQILPPDKLFIYGHTEDGAHPQIFTYHDPYSPNFEYTIEDRRRRSQGGNYDGPVVKAIHEKVRSMTQDRIIFIVLSDGRPAGRGYGGQDDIEDFKRIVERAKRDEFVTCGIFVQYAGMPEMYQYHTQVDDVSEMPKKVSHLLNKVVKTEFQ